MDVREKLVELLKNTEINKLNGHTVLAETCFTPRVFENMATNLIAHGVTVQEWISVKDRLPEESGLYITCGCTTGSVSGKEHPQYRFIEAGNITHWMPLPQPPKGE